MARTLLNSVLFSWSGGKDSCLALYEIQRAESYHVAALLTTITRDYDRISMHGVRRALLKRQAGSLGLPLHEIFITKDATNQEYESRMEEAFAVYRERGINTVVFGDLFLEEIRVYRDQFLSRHNMSALYPVWKRDTAEFIREFIRLGFKAIITCVNIAVLDGSFAGMMIDEDFLAKLPRGVDPCGENGEFHTFVFDGPLFKEAVRFSIGEKVTREGFRFCDLLPE